MMDVVQVLLLTTAIFFSSFSVERLSRVLAPLHTVLRKSWVFRIG